MTPVAARPASASDFSAMSLEKTPCHTWHVAHRPHRAAWLVQEAKPGDWTWDIYHAAYDPLHRIRDLGQQSEDPTLNTPNPIGDAIGGYLKL